ncbi:DUF6090 family protein [Ichthyenterobacterium sp. W332]|uniref:DUF6090 family protein n=1 Tax=Microcosmobacter mediterraneus TaxID=3075607 RepID=A0ABU2YJ36_9FLAO|nr:DUF6090 family protein [Ichthyenterobacterium sp. W332]MDT0558184.1 DUF6090 family protein [Ichthyenterobacterium sp. W332]
MIKFFRHIRQNLLMENKTGKYFKYAIGEIILVVIGILIALQINNWNTDQGNSKKEEQYLNNLVIDLNDQIQVIDVQINSEQGFCSNSKIILDAFNNTRVFVFDSTILKAANMLQDRRTFKIVNPTYTELINTGDMKLISNESFRNRLVSYYQEIDRIKEVIKLNNSYFIDTELGPKIRTLVPTYWAEPANYDYYTKNAMPYEGGISVEKISALMQITQNKLKDKNTLLQFINLVASRYDYGWFHTQIMLTKKTETQQLLDELNKLIQ